MRPGTRWPRAASLGPDALARARRGIAVLAVGRTRHGGQALLDLGARGRIRQQLVGLGDLAEDALEPRAEMADLAPEVAVGVVLARELEVRALDLLGVGAALDAEQLVVRALETPLEVEDAALELHGNAEARVDFDLRLHGRRDALLRRRPTPRAAPIDHDHALRLEALERAIDLERRQAADVAERLPARAAVDPREQETLHGSQFEILGVEVRRESRNPLLLSTSAVVGTHTDPGGEAFATGGGIGRPQRKAERKPCAKAETRATFASGEGSSLRGGFCAAVSPRSMLLSVALGLGLAAPAATLAEPCDFSELDAVVEGLLQRRPAIPGAALRIGRAEGEPLHERFFGSYGPETVVPLASATKLLSAVALMSAVEDGVLGLDTPVSQVLAGFTGDKAGMTPRQMFSHTSGLPGGSDFPILALPDISLAQAAGYIGCCIPLDAPPATQFAYGGLSMQVAGRMLAKLDGRPWDELFAARVAGPLGLTTVDYEGLGETDNPRIAGGARASLRDYAAVLEMLLRGGTHGGARVLEQASIAAMFADQTGGVPIAQTPPGSEGIRYGLGVWRDRVAPDSTPLRVSSPGAFGTTPWLELDLGAYGLFLIDYDRTQILGEIAQIQELARSELLACAPAQVPGPGAAASTALALALAHAARAALRRSAPDR